MSGGRMTRRDALRRLVLFSAGAATLAACAPVTPQVVEEPAGGQATQAVEVGTTGEAVAEIITLKVMQWGDAMGKPDLVNNGAFPRFREKHPNIEPVLEASPEFWTKIQTLAAAGDMPDLYSQSVAYAWDHANKRIALNLQPFLERDTQLDDYFMEIETSCLRYPSFQHGDLYAFPVNWTGGALFYNKNMFDEAGVTYPDETWTYEDMLAAAQALTKREGDEIRQWGMLAPRGYDSLDSVIKAYGGAVLSPDYRSCMLTEPPAIEAIQWAVDARLVHGVAPDAQALQGFPEGPFPSGAVGMQLTNAYSVGPWKEAEFDFDIAYWPAGPAKHVMYGGPDALSIARSSKQKNYEAAWTLLSHYISEEEQMLMDVIEPGTIPFLKKAAYSDTWIDRDWHGGRNMKVLLDQAPDVKGADFGPQWPEWRTTIMEQELDLAYLGERSVEESVQAACTAIQQVLDSIDWPV